MSIFHSLLFFRPFGLCSIVIIANVNVPVKKNVNVILHKVNVSLLCILRIVNGPGLCYDV